jgi:hypothetical protein
MNRLALLLLLLPAPGPGVQVEAKHGRSVRGTIDGLPLLVLKGTAAERGRDHGFLCAKEIVGFIDAFVPVVKSRKGDWERDVVGAARRFVWPKRYEEELAGMAAGIREALPEPSSRTIRALGREIGVDDLKVLNAIADLFGMGCSSFSAWGDLTADGQPITGRNADYTTFPIPLTSCIVAAEPSEKELRPTLSVGAMGLVAAGTTMNAEGVFAALHDESGLPRAQGAAFQPRVLSLQSAVETARAERAVEDVAAALRRTPVAVGNNIHVSGPLVPPAILEWDGNLKEQGVTLRAPNPDEFKSAIVCTNHYRARAERNAGCGRYRSLSDALRRAASDGRRIDVAAAQQMLDRVAPQGASMTYLAVVVQPKARRMSVALASKPGVSATKGRWVPVEWAAVFKD